MPILIAFILLFTSSIASASNVLFIGDSHSVGPFGRALDQHLRDAGHTVTTAASCGSIARWWFTGQKTPCGFFARTDAGVVTDTTSAPTPLLPELLKARPDLVVIELGANYATTPNDDYVKKDLTTLLSTILESGAKCFWVTPPDSRKYRAERPRLLRLITETVGDACPIFNSMLVTKYPETGGDGVHYWSPAGTPIAKDWALKTFEAIKVLWP